VIQRLDLGICSAYEYENDGPTAVALPGAMLGGMPALWWAVAPLHGSGWRVVLIWDEFLDRAQDHWKWTRDRLDAAGPADLMIGKSLGCYAATAGMPAVLLTPVLEDRELVDALRARTAPTLLVGGTDDPVWRRDVAHGLGEVLELPGADHGLARIDQAQQVADAVAAFSAGLGRRRA
jgi:pimeloyl-ACP methyl ester carboxylesterase